MQSRPLLLRIAFHAQQPLDQGGDRTQSRAFMVFDGFDRGVDIKGFRGEVDDAAVAESAQTIVYGEDVRDGCLDEPFLEGHDAGAVGVEIDGFGKDVCC